VCPEGMETHRHYAMIFFCVIKVPFGDPIGLTVLDVKLSIIFAHSQIDYYQMIDPLALFEARSQINQGVHKDRAIIFAYAISRCSVDIDNIHAWLARLDMLFTGNDPKGIHLSPIQ
jgi:hypothetical protein